MSLKFALAGNPNCGKTTLFNALTGANQYVGNWPGVTVEKKEGKLRDKKRGEEIIITDLPGIYSLSPYTLEEVVSRNYLLSENPDVIIDLVDATNIERNLYLTTQLIETGIPVVIALNMSDLIEKRGLKIDIKRLEMLLECTVVEISALKKTGLDSLIDAAVKTAKRREIKERRSIFSSDVEEAVNRVSSSLGAVDESKRLWYAVKALEGDEKILPTLNLTYDEKRSIMEERKMLEEKKDDDIESIITDERYSFIQKVVSSCVKKTKEHVSVSDRIDSIVTNRILGIPIFIAVMFVVYYVSVTTVGTWVTDWTNDTFGGWVAGLFSSLLATIGAGEVVTSLVVDGIIGGLVAVLGFVPQMAILFLFLSILEDCGYMVRIAFVMDRVFRHFGLSGKSFIPLLISSGCGIPGIMASRTIEQENDRKLTIMTATFIPCGAKLPVISLIAGVIGGAALGYSESAWVAPVTYFMGIVAVLISAVILKKTKPFSGKPAPFVMELPSYHIPSARTVLLHVWERLKGFIIKAGTILFLACVVMWFLSGFGFADGSFGMVDSDSSLLASIGGVLSPIFAPLGFGQWQPVAASLSGFTAKEAIVSTMGVLANVAGDVEEAGNVAPHVASWFAQAGGSGALAAFCFLMFNMLDSPCLAAIATMAQQMQSRKWFWFAILFQNLFAYITTMIVFQIGSLVLYGTFGFFTAVALALLVLMLYMLFRKDPYKEMRRAGKRSVEAAKA